jgi:hypothetical protein
MTLLPITFGNAQPRCCRSRPSAGTHMPVGSVPDRVAPAGIFYVLPKGVACRDVPASVVGCSGVTA